MGDIINEASVNDLEWFRQMLEFQLEETPNWVKDEDHLHKLQTWTRLVRTMVGAVLHNKRVAARKRALLLRIGGSVSLVVLGAVIGWALTKFLG